MTAPTGSSPASSASSPGPHVPAAPAPAAVRIAAEERLVVARYPEYREYAARTKRLIPFVL